MNKEYYTKLGNEVIKLIEEKGFRGSLSVDQVFARMQSEVGELINAYKKGLPIGIQEEELADIVIYFFNIADKIGIVGEVEAKWSTGLLKSKAERSPWKAMTTISAAIMYLESVTTEDGQIDKEEVITLPHDDDEAIREAYIDEYANEVLAACETCAEVLNLDLEEGIERKMAKNWNRPYRFNTDPKHFEN